MTTSTSRRSWIVTTAMAAVLCLATARAGEAAPILQIQIEDNTAFGVTLTDMGGGLYEFKSGENNITATGLVADHSGLFTIDVEITTNAPGTPTLAELLTVAATVRVSGQGNAARDVAIMVTDDGFTAPIGPDLELQSSFSAVHSQGGPFPGNFSSFVTDGATTIASIGPHLAGNFAVDFSNNDPFTLSNTTFVHLTPNQSAQTTGTTRVVGLDNGGGGDDPQVPEPASLLLFGLGTLAAGYRARRRFMA